LGEFIEELEHFGWDAVSIRQVERGVLTALLHLKEQQQEQSGSLAYRWC
jgi:hypothetical protein